MNEPRNVCTIGAKITRGRRRLGDYRTLTPEDIEQVTPIMVAVADLVWAIEYDPKKRLEFVIKRYDENGQNVPLGDWYGAFIESLQMITDDRVAAYFRRDIERWRDGEE